MDWKSEGLNWNHDTPTYFTICGTMYTLLKFSKPPFHYLQNGGECQQNWM